MKPHYFVTGISTDVGKTLVAAILVEALHADYWKPIQAGNLENSDAHTVASLINCAAHIHPAAFELERPMSPHAAAELEGIGIKISQIIRPKTMSPLVIEGAGGLMVPINQTDLIADLILPSDRVVLVSRHYLGSINHTLLSIEALKSRGVNKIALLFSGAPAHGTEEIIVARTGIFNLGRIEEEKVIDKKTVNFYANRLQKELLLWEKS